jgi:SpoVK/Ycf46/Vps4 family AAA+-type ATPase
VNTGGGQIQLVKLKSGAIYKKLNIKSILDRPSRFDRKYRFDLPALPERMAYIKHWNRALRNEMRLTDSEAMAIAEYADRFSFAYLKELFLSAMMEWIGDQESGRTDGSMGEALL